VEKSPRGGFSRRIRVIFFLLNRRFVACVHHLWQLHTALISLQLLVSQAFTERNREKNGSPKLPGATKLPGKTAMFRKRNVVFDLESCHVDKLC
jgi:hypothetical protein